MNLSSSVFITDFLSRVVAEWKAYEWEKVFWDVRLRGMVNTSSCRRLEWLRRLTTPPVSSNRLQLWTSRHSVKYRTTWNLAIPLWVECSWNVMAHCNAREEKQRENWRMEWVSSTLYTTSEHGLSSITTADAHISAASSRLNWRPHRFKWTRPFCRKTKSGFCACAITFQKQSASKLSNQICDLEIVSKSYSTRGRVTLQPSNPNDCKMPFIS
jgi:hypothetical protein